MLKDGKKVTTKSTLNQRWGGIYEAQVIAREASFRTVVLDRQGHCAYSLGKGSLMMLGDTGSHCVPIFLDELKYALMDVLDIVSERAGQFRGGGRDEVARLVLRSRPHCRRQRKTREASSSSQQQD